MTRDGAAVAFRWQGGSVRRRCRIVDVIQRERVAGAKRRT
jgi:hypothetical protein